MSTSCVWPPLQARLPLAQLPRLPTHLPDETICGTAVCVRSHKLFDLKLPAAAALTLAAG